MLYHTQCTESPHNYHADGPTGRHQARWLLHHPGQLAPQQSASSCMLPPPPPPPQRTRARKSSPLLHIELPGRPQRAPAGSLTMATQVQVQTSEQGSARNKSQGEDNYRYTLVI